MDMEALLISEKTNISVPKNKSHFDDSSGDPVLEKLEKLEGKNWEDFDYDHRQNKFYLQGVRSFFVFFSGLIIYYVFGGVSKFWSELGIVLITLGCSRLYWIGSEISSGCTNPERENFQVFYSGVRCGMMVSARSQRQQEGAKQEMPEKQI